MTEARKHLQHTVSEFERACDSMRLKINVGKRKVLTIKKDQVGSCEKVRVNGEEMQEVDNFNYMGVMISTDGGMWVEWLIGCLRDEGLGNDGEVVEGENNTQRS